MTTRLNVAGKDRVMSERGITTKIKNEADGKLYWIATTRRVDGTWITGVAKTRMFGIPGEHIWDITTATSEDEAMELHFAAEEIVQKQPRDRWEPSLPEARLAARRYLDESVKQGLLGQGRTNLRQGLTTEERAELVADRFPQAEIEWMDGWIKGGSSRTFHELKQQLDVCEREVRQFCERLEEVAKSGSGDPQLRARLQATRDAGIIALAQVNAEVLHHAWTTMYQDATIPQGWKETLLPVIQAAMEKSAEREQKAAGH